MNLEYQHLLPPDFAPSSRVWVYQSSRLFTVSEALEIEEILKDFVQGWNTHGVPVKGYANLFFGRFIVIMADETVTGVSGCSTDSSVRVLKNIEQKFGVNMFDRQTLAFVVKDTVELLPLLQLRYAIDNGFIDAGTLYFNNLVSSNEELQTNWIIPAGKSWLATRFAFPQPA